MKTFPDKLFSSKDQGHKVKKFNQTLLSWGKENFRDFPWRKERTPYKVFIAEFLLKRTTSTAAERNFVHIIRHLPDLNSIVNTGIPAIEQLLRPVGLYKQRAKGLFEAANFVIKEYDGIFPRDYGLLNKIPHIGPYSASCILSFGLDCAYPTVDSNVYRVLSRIFKDSFKNKATINRIFLFADKIMPKRRHVQFNYGLLDFGALVCSYRGCSGPLCPMCDFCDTFRDERESH